MKFIDLFCGAGGLSTGLTKAGLQEVFSCDYNLDSVETMKLNHPNTISLHRDITELKNSEILKLVGDQKINLVAGGPPCQGFSTIGKGDPKDSRNQLFKEFVRVVKCLDPEFVLFENVTGLLSKKNELVLDSIIKSFSKLGYGLHIKIMQAQKFGVPQTRRRTIIVGVKKGFDFQFPKETHDTLINEKYKKPVSLGNILSKIKGERKLDKNHDLEKSQLKSKLERDRLKHIPEGGSIRYQKDEIKYLPKKLRLGVNWETLRENRLRECHYRRLDRKLPVPTINTNNNHYYHPLELRKFTLRELALMQSFPINYKFFGSRTSIIRQIGNAVPPKLAETLGHSLLESWTSQGKSKKINRVKKKELQELRSSAFVY